MIPFSLDKSYSNMLAEGVCVILQILKTNCHSSRGKESLIVPAVKHCSVAQYIEV